MSLPFSVAGNSPAAKFQNFGPTKISFPAPPPVVQLLDYVFHYTVFF